MYTSYFSSCVRVDVFFLNVGPEFDLASTSSSADLTCAGVTGEAGADVRSDLSGDDATGDKGRKLQLQLLRLGLNLRRHFRRNSNKEEVRRTLPCSGFDSWGGRS